MKILWYEQNGMSYFSLSLTLHIYPVRGEKTFCIKLIVISFANKLFYKRFIFINFELLIQKLSSTSKYH